MCATCGCGKKKGEPGFGKGPKKKATKKAAAKGMSPKQKTNANIKAKLKDENSPLNRAAKKWEK